MQDTGKSLYEPAEVRTKWYNPPTPTHETSSPAFCVRLVKQILSRIGVHPQKNMEHFRTLENGIGIIKYFFYGYY